MGWRENMGVLKSNPSIQKVQNIQKPPEHPPFVPIVPFVDRESKIKTDPAPPPDLSKIQPEHRSEYTTLWYQAHALADYIDDSNAAPYEDRAAKLPELNELVERIRDIESRTKAAKSTRQAKEKPIPGLPDDLIQAPAAWRPGATGQADHPDTCPACGQSRWWRKDEPGSKWICGRCHPPAAGLDVIFRDE